MIGRSATQISVGVTIALFLGLMLGLAFAQIAYEWLGLLLVALSIATLALLFLPRMASQERSRLLLQILIVGLILKLGVSMIRIWVSFDVYGNADVVRYHEWGIWIAQRLREMEFGQATWFLQRGTNFIHFFTGVVYAVIGPTLYGGYLVYGLLAFLGSYYFYKAFRTAFPERGALLFAVMVFLFPSIVFWANGINKDALMALALGLSAYGSVRLLRGQMGGAIPLAVGLLGALWVRPHMAGILAIALAVAFLIPRRSSGSARRGSYFSGMVVAAGLVWFLMPKVTSFLALDQLSATTILDYISVRQSQTIVGGSAYQTTDIRNVMAIPMAAVNVLFRPFPWEAHNLQAMIQSLDGVLFIGVVIWRFKSLWHAIASSLSDPVLRYVLAYTAMFIVAFSTLGNFGLLARERAMLLPFVFMLLAYSPHRYGAELSVTEEAT